MAKDNETPDGGYSHFLPHGMKAPHQGKLVDKIGDKRAMNSGSNWQGPLGVDPVGKMPGQKNVPGSGGV